MLGLIIPHENFHVSQFKNHGYMSFQAIETGFGYGQWLHGEAVAAGTVIILTCIFSSITALFL